ncbi:MFS transporter [Kitasatospora sp. HPMI-4]|uniref:MFS transporter n=1 Tax=Kitasatospora sp. HPMI-4 TaxID=3448443 RepID=UPI003F1CA7F1
MTTHQLAAPAATGGAESEVQSGEEQVPAAEAQAGPETHGRPAPLRKNRDFLLLWTGAGLSTIGMRATAAAYPLLLVWQGGSPVAAGVLGFAAMLPRLVSQLPAGIMVDRWDRRRLMVLSNLVGLLTMASVAVAVALGHIWLWHLTTAAFLEGSAGIVYLLAERAAVRQVVPEAQLPAALSQNEARGQASGLLGQPAGSALFALLRWMPFGVSALAHLLSLGALLMVRTDLSTERRTPSGSVRAELAEGFGWVWRNRFIRTAVGLVAGSNMAFQVVALGLVLVVARHGASPAAMGLIGLGSGLGGVAGALAGSWFMDRLSVAGIVTGSLVLWAVLLVPMALSSQVPVLAGLSAAAACAGALLSVAAGVYQVRMTPDELQGRVSSVFALISSGLNSIGVLGAGFLLAHFGTTRTILGAAAVMAALAVVAIATPAVRRAA